MGEVARLRWARACFAAAAAGVAVLIGMQLLPGEPSGQGSGDESSTQSFAHFSISGDGDLPISPGATESLNLKLDNPHDQSLTIVELVVSLRVEDAPNADPQHPCTSADFIVTQASGALPMSLPAERTSTMQDLHLPENQWPRLGMLNRDVNQDGCKGSTIALDYSATGRVGR